jgi:hypothetical protein
VSEEEGVGAVSAPPLRSIPTLTLLHQGGGKEKLLCKVFQGCTIKWP